YPTRAQYSIIVVGILNHLGVEHGFLARVINLSKYKRERQNLSDDKVIEMKHRYSKVLEDVKILTSMYLDNSVKERMDVLSSKICSDNQFPADNPSIRYFKVLCSILNDSWKHYTCFYPEKPVTPQPTIVVEDDNIKFIVIGPSFVLQTQFEQSLAVLVDLYGLMNLKFHAYRAAIRFLYAYFLNDKQQQSNNIRRFCKEYNIELRNKPPASFDQLATKTNNNTLDPDELENSDHDLIIDSEEKNTAIIHNEDQSSMTIFVPNNRPTT
ncbi:unnamed protein product, partial [Rotaria magnacalcarata]